jgi:hypothetical protein
MSKGADNWDIFWQLGHLGQLGQLGQFRDIFSKMSRLSSSYSVWHCNFYKLGQFYKIVPIVLTADSTLSVSYHAINSRHFYKKVRILRIVQCLTRQSRQFWTIFQNCPNCLDCGFNIVRIVSCNQFKTFLQKKSELSASYGVWHGNRDNFKHFSKNVRIV